jgi:ribosomal protein S18 acetylase RimI-like enzyme
VAVTKMELRQDEFFPKLWANESLSVQRLTATSCRFAAFLWGDIDTGNGEDRAEWDNAHWQFHLSSPGSEFYAVYCDGEPAGFAEIKRSARLMNSKGGAARIEAFGLLPEFSGEGLGSSLLTRVVEKCFATGAASVTLKSEIGLPLELIEICRRQGFRVLSS